MMPKSLVKPVNLILILKLVAVVFSTNAYTKNCYAPDGTQSTPDFAPCIMVAGVDSMCCATNRTTNVDECQPNGLCLNTDSNAYYFDYCTDATWESPNCLRKNTCTTASGGLLQRWNEMTQCPNGSWCCGEGNFTDCCDLGLGFTLANDLVTFNSPNATAAVTTVTASARPTGGSSDDVGRGAIIGVGVGLSILAVIAGLGGFFTGLLRGKRMGRNGNDGVMYSGVNFKAPRVEMHETQRIPAAELGEL